MNPRYLLLYVPVFFAFLIHSTNPSLAYWIAWGGSFWIYLITFTGVVRKLPNDRSVLNQVFRPFFLVHLIFSGYMAVTSIFFYLDAMGYLYLDKIKAEESYLYISTIAYCQFLYCLGHAAYVHGLLLFLEYKSPKYAIKTTAKFSISRLFLYTSIFLFILSILFRFLPGGTQFLGQFQSTMSVFAIFAFGYALLERRKKYIFIGGILFLYGEYQALLSGWKELAMLPIILLIAILWKKYKKMILIVFPFIIFIFLFIIPYYTQVVRTLSWSNKLDGQEAAVVAIEKIRTESLDGLLEKNWAFLTGRLSEIGMFVIYVDKVPSEVPYMTKEILSQSLESIIPRLLYSEKDVTELLVMERVYQLGVVDRNSSVSAKPAFITDAYYMGGELGVWISLLLLGCLSTFLSKKAESLFGGYIIGSGGVFLGLFSIVIRGNAFEFLVNSIFWSAFTMYALFYIAQKFNILVKNPNYE